MLKKNINKLVSFVAAFTLLMGSDAKASHIVGGQIEYKWISGNVYEITLNFYRDCVGISLPPSVQICFFDKLTDAAGPSITILMDTSFILALGDACYTPPGVCVQLGVFTDTISLANNPNGYYMMYSTSARNSILYNVNPSNMTWYTEMPDPALHNSGPHFINYPRAYFCHSYPNYEQLSAVDVDGDSLKYYMEIPLLGLLGCVAKPAGGYSQVTYRNGCSVAQPLGAGSVQPVMDVVTGVMNLTPNVSLLGRLVVLAYRVEEWRNGIKIGETRRDMQYTVLTCQPNIPPYFTEQPNYGNYAIAAGEELCFNIKVSDLNIAFGTQPANGVFLTYDSEMLDPVSNAPKATITLSPLDSVTAPDTASVKICIATRCDQIRPEPYRFIAHGNDTSCYGVNTIDYKLDVLVVLPGIVDLYPNIFTPNGDKKNDTFKTNALPPYCFDEFEVIIYNRWGNQVFTSTNFLFAWDGKNKNGKDEDDGVYYYTLKSKFQETANEERGFVHLIR